MRVALWALPAFALIHLWQSVRATPALVDDPAAWSQWVTSGGYGWLQAVTGFGGTLLGLVAIIALTALLAGGRRGRGLAAAGLVTGLAAAILDSAHRGVAAFAAPVLGDQVRAGDTGAAETYERAYGMGEPWLPAGTAATITDLGWGGPLWYGGPWLLAAASLMTLAWTLFGLAVWRGLSRGDGLLILLAAPLLGLVGGLLVPAVPLGALLLAAAGIGIAWSRGRSRVRQPQ